jgi:hypothetical protein
VTVSAPPPVPPVAVDQSPSMPVARLNRIAWLLIWSGFALFCLLCAGAGYTAAWVRSTSMVPDRAELKAPSGAVSIQPRGFGIWNTTGPGTSLRAGDQVRTAADSSADIQLPDGSLIELFPDTQVRLDALERGRFLPDVRRTAIQVVTGVARVKATPPRSPRSRFEVWLPRGTALLDPGTYVARVHEPALIELATDEQGRASLIGGPGTGLIVDPKQRVTLAGAEPRVEPARQSLLVNGDFADPIDRAWQTGVDRLFGGSEDTLGSVERVVIDNDPALFFRRTGSRGHWTETYARQNLDYSLAGYRSLKLRFQVKLVYQNVPGGGYKGSEYPFLVRLKFRNPKGEPLWVQGFFYQNDAGNPTNNGRLIARGDWVMYESPNLLNEIDKANESELLAVELTASGHDYASYVRNVELIAE